MSTFTVGNQTGAFVDDLDILEPAKDNRDLVIARSGEFNYAMRLNSIVVCMDSNEKVAGLFFKLMVPMSW